MKKRLVFIPLFLVFTFIFTIMTPTVSLCEDISKNVFRLHIVANSDSKQDQQLKLKVRDSILEISKTMFNGCDSVEASVKTANENIETIKETAKKTITEHGYNYAVKVSVDKEYFKTRYYDTFTLPAGVYDCLRIEIGEGKGHNWWCVLFPSVCLSGCTADFDGVLSEEEKKLITSDDYVVRFKAVEIYEKLKNSINNN